MSFCPECGEENPEGSKFCRKCGINLVHETPETEPKKETTAKKVTVEDSRSPINPRPVNTSNTSNNSNEDSDRWCWCCVCIVFLFIVFAILGH